MKCSILVARPYLLLQLLLIVKQGFGGWYQYQYHQYRYPPRVCVVMMHAAVVTSIPFFVQPIQAESNKKISSTTAATTSTTTSTGSNTSTNARSEKNSNKEHVIHQRVSFNDVHLDEEEDSQEEEEFSAVDHREQSKSSVHDKGATLPGILLPLAAVHNQKIQHEEDGNNDLYTNPSLQSMKRDYVTPSSTSTSESYVTKRRLTIICNEESQIPFRLELKTDSSPQETSWKVVDLERNETIAEKPQGSYTAINTIHIEDLCIETKACVGFTINDAYGNGLSCSEGDGFYNVYYNNKFAKGGGAFGFSETTMISDSCFTLTPTMSSQPSTAISISPSSMPTLSTSPTTTKYPSAQPSISYTPTFSPTPEFDSIAIDKYGRRYYPRNVSIEQSESLGIYLYEPVPNCTQQSIGRIGCIATPQSFVDNENAPDWAGSLYQKPPICIDKKCNQGIPMSRKAHSLNLTMESVIEVENYLNIQDISSDDTSTVIIALGDVNGDGRIDIVIGNYGEENQLLMNSGNGALSDGDPVSLPGGSRYTYSIVLGDVNGDGLVDILIGNFGEENQLLINSGNGTFSDTNVVSLPGGSKQTISLALGDVNGDGRMDIVVGNYGEENQLFINPDDGTIFDANPVSLPGGGKNTFSVALGDINGDGHIDIVVGNQNQPNQVLVNSSDGTFSYNNHVSLPGGIKQSISLALGDVDGDGSIDIVFGNYNQPNQLLLNSGDGTFSDKNTVNLPGGGKYSRSLALGDINGDGRIDIVVGNSDQDSQILINSGDGTFSDMNAVKLPGGTMNTRSLALGDVNDNGRIDIAVGNFGQTNQVLVNSSDGTFSDTSTLSLPGGSKQTISLAVGDVNGDGRIDIVIGNYGQENQLLVNLGDGTLSDMNVVSLPGGGRNTYCIALGDVNGDGHIDIAIGKLGEENQLLINSGNGTFSDTNTVSLPGGSSNTHSLALGDVNGDGSIDIVIGNYGQENQLLINTGDGTFSDTNTVNLPGGSRNTKSLVLGDINGDGRMDIVVGNSYQQNQVLMNSRNADTLFSDANIGSLSGGNWNTFSLALGDVNGDGHIDIAVGNRDQESQILINSGNGTFADTHIVSLPGGWMDTNSLALGDVNGDGHIDIVLGNSDKENQLLINAGDGTFSDANTISLPGGTKRTFSLVLGDINGDGYIDIVVGNYNDVNEVLHYTFCQSGGAPLYANSWCFKCPSFMGRELDSPFCRECIPDFSSSSGELCDLPCSLGERKVGQDICTKCANGTFYDNSFQRSVEIPQTWNHDRCVDCPTGTYANDDIAAVNECFSCNPGFYQPNKSASQCIKCDAGYYQPDFGQASCIPCATGGYCGTDNSDNGGFTPCSPGTYNSYEGQSGSSSCIACSAGTYNDKTGMDQCSVCPTGKYSNSIGGTSCISCVPGSYQDTVGAVSCDTCPIGTYSIKTEASNITDCLVCKPGSFNNQTGSSFCLPCEPGTYQDQYGSFQCNPCKSGTYADKIGFEACIDCPYRLNSTAGSKLCPMCDSGFFLNDISIIDTNIFEDPFQYCDACPDETTICEINTTLFDLGIQPGFWRLTRETSSIYSCKSDKICVGEDSARKRDKSAENDSMTGRYCKENHTGPLCEVCIEKGSYFNEKDIECQRCPSPFRVAGFLILIVLVISFALALMVFLVKRFTPSLIDAISKSGPRAKLKLFVTFYQVFTSLQDVYGITISSRLKVWINLYKWLSIDLLHIASVPLQCIGSTVQQLLITTLWPFMLTSFVVLVICIYYLLPICSKWFQMEVMDMDINVKPTERENIVKSLQKRIIQAIIIILYFALPLVSEHIFDAVKCRAFNIDNKEPPTSISYLLMDLTVQCSDREDSTHRSILSIFWILLSLWIVVVPMAFFGLLKYVSPSIESGSITFLADACRFLWEDYNPSIWFWDIIDTMRKMFLTGIIIFIDIDNGSNKILRLVVASIVSLVFAFILLAFNPYKRKDDYYLALVSNFLLICFFVMGIILKLCSMEAVGEIKNGQDLCMSLVGNSLDSYTASILVVCLTLSMAIITILSIFILAVRNILAPSVRIISTGNAPNLELPSDCKSHIFMSHVWATGQAKTHAISRKLQLLLPGLKVWLDVDSLHDISLLEESVKSTAIFVLYYSEGYFESRNCRREIYAAIKFNKPIILIFSGEGAVLNTMREECSQHCDSDKVGTILSKLLSLRGDEDSTSTRTGPIQWHDEGSFSAAALGQIYHRIFLCLPYYIKNKKELAQGIMVPGTMDPISLYNPISILVLEENIGCLELVDELKTLVSLRESNLISVIDASVILPHDTSETDIEANVDIFEENLLHNTHYQGIELSSSLGSSTKSQTFMLLYLNDKTFTGSNEYITKLANVLKSCQTNDSVQLVLVQEKDLTKGGCDFGLFFSQAPQELINPPFTIFRDIAIPLYAIDMYRAISLKQILSKMGASERSPNGGLMKRITRSS